MSATLDFGQMLKKARHKDELLTHGLTAEKILTREHEDRILKKLTEQQEHWVTLPSGQHIPIGFKSERAKQTVHTLQRKLSTPRLRPELYKVYMEDPEFKELADAVAAFTDGQNALITKAAEEYVKEGEQGLKNVVMKPRSYDPKNEFHTADPDGPAVVEGKHPLTDEYLEGKTREDMARYGLLLNHAIATAPEEPRIVYRGASAKNQIEEFEKLKPGDEFQMAGPRSFSYDKKQAQFYAKEPTKYLFVLEGNSKGINAATLSNFSDEEEFITSGKFKVNRVEDGIFIGSLQQAGKTIRIQQTGVF